MARFRSLSEAIAHQIKEIVYIPTPNPGTPFAPPTLQKASYAPQANVFRWGVSTWGIDAITGSTSSIAN